MNCDKKLSLTHSKFKPQRWRIGLIWGLIIAVGIIYSGCSKKDETSKDEYYVKYEVNSSTIYIGKLNVVINAENNQNKSITINSQTPWETVIGPVKKGFESNLSVSEIGSNYGHLTLYTQISVSKNSSPFALKKIDNSDVPRTSAQINYTIDF
jgi:hypothetical protein